MRFNGMDPHEISPQIFPAKEVIGAIPPRTLRMLDTAGGALYGGIDLGARQIKIVMNIAGRNHDHANELVTLLNGRFCTDEPAELEPTHWPGKAFTAILESAGDLEWRWGYGTVEYTFSAPRPYAHSVDERHIRFSGSTLITPTGTIPMLPKITHTMSAAASALAISCDSVPFFRVRPATGGFSAGETITIDFSKRLVTRADVATMSLVDYTASTWHPDIRAACLLSVSDAAGDTEVRWRDEWM